MASNFAGGSMKPAERGLILGSAQSAVPSAETKTALMMARKKFQGNKKKAEIEMEQYLESIHRKKSLNPTNNIQINTMGPNEIPPSHDIQIQLLATNEIHQAPRLPSVNFLKLNKIKLRLKEKEMLNEKVRKANKTSEDFTLKQFSRVTSKYMTDYFQFVQRNKPKRVSSISVLKTPGKKIFRKNVSRPTIMNRIAVSSRYMDFYEKIKNSRITPQLKNTQSTHKIGKKKNVRYNKTKLNINKIQSSTQTKVLFDSTTKKRPNNVGYQKSRGKKIKRKSRFDLKSINGIEIKSRYMNFMKNYQKSKAQGLDQQILKQTNNRRNAKTGLVGKINEEALLSEKKAFLRHKVCNGAYMKDFERKYNERFVAWYKARHPNLFEINISPQTYKSTKNRRGDINTVIKKPARINIVRKKKIIVRRNNSLTSKSSDDNIQRQVPMKIKTKKKRKTKRTKYVVKEKKNYKLKFTPSVKRNQCIESKLDNSPKGKLTTGLSIRHTIPFNKMGKINLGSADFQRFMAYKHNSDISSNSM